MMTSSNKRLTYTAFTHAGKCHHQNQDAVLLAGDVQQHAGFWQGELTLDKPLRFAVADGVGGLPSGDKASRLLLQALAELDAAKPHLLPRQRLIPLQNRLVNVCQQQRSLRNAGTTLVTAEIATDGRIALWHAGDSRGYHYGAKGLRRLTDDHTLAFCLGRFGSHTPSNVQAFGNTSMGKALDNLFIFSPEAEEPFIGLQWLRLLPNEILLLVSDGVTLHLSDELLATCLNGNDMATTMQQLFDAVMAAGAEDNLSAVAIALQ